jgi:hypothetical protein
LAPEPQGTQQQEREHESLAVLEAARLLKREHRPTEAMKLLDGYFRRFPNGVMEEEALALSIEAAAAGGDARRSELARRYLPRFPAGRFRDLALKNAGEP